jgi:FAD synthetase
MIQGTSILSLKSPLKFWYNNAMAVKNKKSKIMVFGTFDGLHPRHVNFFKQARSLHQFPFLIVSIARDKNVFRIKGKYAHKNERQRMKLVKKYKLIDKVILSGIRDHIPHIKRVRPDVIALGYDQSAYVKNLKKDLKNKGILVKIVRLKSFKEKTYKNHLLKNMGEI